MTAAILLGNATATLVVYRRLRRAATDGNGPADGRTDPDASVACPACGAENDPWYRFCRKCVAELPAGARTGRPAAAPLGGRAR